MDPALEEVKLMQCTWTESKRGGPEDMLQETSIARYTKPDGGKYITVYSNCEAMEPIQIEYIYNCECDIICDCEFECRELGIECRNPQGCTCFADFQRACWVEFPDGFIEAIMGKFAFLYSPSDNYQMVEVINSYKNSVYFLSMLLPSEILDFSEDRYSKISDDWEEYLA
jgi:hypothetical protein